MTARNPVRGLAALGGFVGLIALLAAPGAALSGEDEAEEGPQVFCDYVDAGDPGVAGNLLAVTVVGDEFPSDFNSLVRISVAKANGRIRVRAAEGRTSCEGGRPTVTNVDSVRVVLASGTAVMLDQGGAPYAPGATDEGGRGSEIEITVAGEYGYLYVRGGPGPSRMAAGAIDDEGLLGVNLNPRGDGRRDDADLTAGAETGVILLGGRGADSLVHLGPEDPDESFTHSFVYLVGGAGDDSLRLFEGSAVGGPGNDVLRGAGGLALLLGRGGNDTLLAGGGADYLVGGNGEDEYRGGAGRDVLLARDGRGERVDCGPGKDRLRSSDPGDGRRSCEQRQRGERGDDFFFKAPRAALRN